MLLVGWKRFPFAEGWFPIPNYFVEGPKIRPNKFTTQAVKPEKLGETRPSEKNIFGP